MSSVARYRAVLAHAEAHSRRTTTGKLLDMIFMRRDDLQRSMSMLCSAIAMETPDLVGCWFSGHRLQPMLLTKDLPLQRAQTDLQWHCMMGLT